MAGNLNAKSVLTLVGPAQSGKSWLFQMMKEKDIAGYVLGTLYKPQGIVEEIKRTAPNKQVICIDDAYHGRKDLAELIFRECTNVRLVLFSSTHEVAERKAKAPAEPAAK